MTNITLRKIRVSSLKFVLRYTCINKRNALFVIYLCFFFFCCFQFESANGANETLDTALIIYGQNRVAIIFSLSDQYKKERKQSSPSPNSPDSGCGIGFEEASFKI